ncbi:MAG: anhydro-N-acetylmuramic acid kinase [Holosporales bacterium]|jgi:anhydro-N-acetylmuramic acid kinase|nr:anhydro-N-acetylmuramic acid kinase [Holosporales bacterium]
MDFVHSVGIYGNMIGVQVSLALTDGKKIMDTASLFLPYPPDLRQRLTAFKRNVNTSNSPDKKLIHALDAEVSDWFVQASRLLFERIHCTPTIIGLYGQPIFFNNATWFLGSPKLLVSKLGIPVAYDFHRTDAIAGGNGHFLHAPYYRAVVDRAVELGDIEPPSDIAIINVSDVSSVTILPANGEPIAFDAGPGLALVDEFTQIALQSEDTYGEIASKGDVCVTLLNQLKRELYRMPVPSSVCDLRKFLPYVRLFHKCPPLDGVATLTTFIGQMIEHSFIPYPGVKLAVLAGRGTQNAFFKTLLASSFQIITPSSLSWNSHFEQSEQAAFNAVRRLHSLTISYLTTTGVLLVCGRIKRVMPAKE